MADQRGGKPNPGTSKDGRLKDNKVKHKRDASDWAGELAGKSGPAPDVSPVKDSGKGILD